MTIRITDAEIVDGTGTDTAVVQFTIEESLVGGPDPGDSIEWTVIRTDGPGPSAQESGEFGWFQLTEIEAALGPLDPGTHEITIFAGNDDDPFGVGDGVTLTFDAEEDGNGGGEPGPAPDPDGLTVDTAAVSRREVPEEGFVTISAVVTNHDANQTRGGTLEVFDRDDDLLATDDVTVGGGQSELFEIALQLSKIGDRLICVQIIEQED